MEHRYAGKRLSRRDLLKWGGGAMAAAAGAAFLPRNALQPSSIVQAERALAPSGLAQLGFANAPTAQGNIAPDLHLAATDGWISINAPAVPPYHPDDVAPPGLTTYIFGFRNVTGFSDEEVHAQKMRAQLVAPIFTIDQEYAYTLKLTNLGLQVRPDLIDAHTVHFHGFRNAIPIFDGEPHSSVGVPIIRDLTYYYKPHHPGTYMYHCHFEETEHVHMGMVGGCWVHPLLNHDTEKNPNGHKYVYNDLGSRYDREWMMMLYEVWSEAHWCDSHIQLPEWTDYRPDLFLLNGRAYPDTLLPPGRGVDPNSPDKDLLGPTDDRNDLRYQPYSSLVRANPGEHVLLRFINLGYTEVSMRLAGIKMRIIGRDAMPLVNTDPANPRPDLSFMTSTAPVGPGETADAIFVAPPFVGGQGLSDERGPYDRYLLFNRSLTHMGGGAGSGYGGQMTEVRIYQNPLPPQTAPNT
jgi:FtsP/CotA-like multicopper oxidase with cupredoxin domain